MASICSALSRSPVAMFFFTGIETLRHGNFKIVLVAVDIREYIGVYAELEPQL